MPLIEAHFPWPRLSHSLTCVFFCLLALSPSPHRTWLCCFALPLLYRARARQAEEEAEEEERARAGGNKAFRLDDEDDEDDHESDSEAEGDGGEDGGRRRGNKKAAKR